MNIQVKHNGTNISGYTLSYEREHKICTGIGSITVIIDRTIPRTFKPWDTIDIYENGDFKVRYYVSSVNDSEPKGILTLDCQDISKRLVDYFIPDSYNIDYPSYTGYWIAKFLTEAGVDYQFQTSSPGTLISNNTQLGLVTVYEQITTLLQMSGWYIYFDGNEKAIIGSLDVDLAVETASVGKTDILKITRVSDDKMLRNRALVLGAYDFYTGTYAAADVTVHTPWNYDHRDVRAVVISNSNIPNRNVAYGMANQIIKEFARITVEKHITLWGARNYTLGTALRVNTRVWRGKGLITTFGVSMGKDGLVTNVILDERCPRLFGYFNFGDYVYVATMGDGVWRKHIKFDPTWYNFSTGLTNLNITDMHINNGIFGSVGSEGELFYANSEDGPWRPISVSGLESSIEDVVTSGELMLTMYSGIKARAVIVDKTLNTVKFGLDNWSGGNLGDYFMMVSGWMQAISVSGMTVVGSGEEHSRGWIVEYDPYTGLPVGGIGSGIYPISYSGIYNMQVIDLENDGKNDYVSVKTVSSGFVAVPSGGYNYGSFTTNSVRSLQFPYEDDTSRSFFDYTSQFLEEGETLYQQIQSTASSLFAVFENEQAGEADIVWVVANLRLSRTRFSKVYDPTLGRTRVTSSTLTSTLVSDSTFGPVKISKLSSTVYRLWGLTYAGTGIAFTVKYKDWDTATNTWGTTTTLFTYSHAYDPDAGPNYFVERNTVVFEDVIHAYAIVWHPSYSPFGGTLYNYIEIYDCAVDTVAATASAGLLYRADFHTSGGNIGVGDWEIESMTGGHPHVNPIIFKTSEGIGLSFFVREWNSPIDSTATSFDNWLISTNNGQDFQLTNIQHTTTNSDPNFLYGGSDIGWQLTGERYLAGIHNPVSGLSYIFNGVSVTIANIGTPLPFQLEDSNIYTTSGQYDLYYIAKNGTNWWVVNPHTMALMNQITFPANYTVSFPFSTIDTSNQVLWSVINNDTTKREILRTTWNAPLSSPIIPFSQPIFTLRNGIICGKIFVNYSSTGIRSLYIDNQLIAGRGTTFMVLQRDGSDFHLIEEEIYPIRTDISNWTPVLTVGSGESSFISNFVYDTELVVVEPLGLNFTKVEDYRYTLLEPTLSGIVSSGVGLASTVLYVTGSGVFGADSLSYSGGFSLVYGVPSGHGTRIETSNFGVDGQYVFITASGDTQMFYQKNPEQFGFVAYSGMPQNRATIIRLDDRV